MIMRMTGIAMIVFSCAGLGVIKSAQLQKRYRLLKEWERLIVLLEQEISYNAALPEACRRVGRKARPPFNSFLDSLSGRLKDCGGTPFPRILEEESSRYLKDGYLTKEDLQSISMLGEMMGFGDRQTQKEMLKRYGKELEIRLSDLKEQLPGKQKLYRSLGFLGGAFLGILLL